MPTEKHEVFSVSGGKFHFPAVQDMERGRAWRPTLTVCGITVTPQNYFATMADADAHTGGRLESRWLCRHCAERRPVSS